MTNTGATANISAKAVLRMARAELKVYGDTERYRSLIALWNRTVTAEREGQA